MLPYAVGVCGEGQRAGQENSRKSGRVNISSDFSDFNATKKVLLESQLGGCLQR